MLLQIFNDVILPAALWPWGSTQPLTEISNRNISWRGTGGRCVGLTTLPPSCADYLEIREPEPHGTLMACRRIALSFITSPPNLSTPIFLSQCHPIQIKSPPRNTNFAKPHLLSPSRFRTISPSTLFTNTLNHSSSNVVIHGHQTMPHAALNFCSTLQSILTTCMALHDFSLCTEMSK